MAGPRQHMRLRRDSRTGYKGVSMWGATGTRWRAQIVHSGRPRHLGLFDSPEAAARAYDAAALELFGPDAWTNADHTNLQERP